uniref:Nudix hydrolase domain-containing protein n=1 Tax=Fibrocapsa japonica TaxID=94617 RepID=A0A7S2XUX9_9STRA
MKGEVEHIYAPGTEDDARTPYRYHYRWPRPSVTTDSAVFTIEDGAAWVLLIKRLKEPFQGCWALPGGFLEDMEGLDACSARELEEETSISGLPMVQVGAFADPGRDPTRGHVLTVAYAACAPYKSIGVKAQDDAADAEWFQVSRLPPLAFDHFDIMKVAWARIQFTTTPGKSLIEAIDRGTLKPLAKYDCEKIGIGLEQLQQITPTLSGTQEVKDQT